MLADTTACSFYLRFSVLAVTKHLLCSYADGKFSDKAHNGDGVRIFIAFRI